MYGKFYAVGVGPGDPELMTLKAARILAESDVIAAPAKGQEMGLAYRIAAAAVPAIEQKETLPLRFPMLKAEAEWSRAHDEAVNELECLLRQGKTVSLLTLGDPTLYATCAYVQSRLRDRGILSETISGVPSFCAAAARLGIPLALGEEAILITPYAESDAGSVRTAIILKAGRDPRRLKERLAGSGQKAYWVENCGMKDERIREGAEHFPDEAGYLSLVILKEA